MSGENSYVFRVYVKDQRRAAQVQEEIDSIEIGDLEWDSVDTKRDGSGVYVSVEGSMSTRFVPKVEARLKKIPGVDRVKRMSGGAAPSASRGGKDKCSSEPLLDDHAVRVVNASIDYAMGQLRVMRGHLATAKAGNIRGRLVVKFDGVLAVGSSYSVAGKMRYHESNWPLTDATTITWYASRSSNAFVQVATGPTYTPIVEDAGKRISLEIHNKGVSSEFDVGAVQVSQELEDSTLQILKKKRTLKMQVTTLSELPPEEQAKAGKRGSDAVQLSKKGIRYIKGGSTLYDEEYGPNAVVTSVRGEVDCAMLHISGQEIKIRFESAADCVQFVMAARAYSAYDKVCLICSLPPVDKEINPNVSIVNALIQAGSAVEPYAWDPAQELEPGLPEVDDSDVKAIAKAVQQLVSDRRIKASSHAILIGMLSAISQGGVSLALPKPQEWVEPDSEEEPEDPSEEEPEPVAEAASAIPEGEWSLPMDKCESYKSLFNNVQDGNVVKGKKAMEIYLKSGQSEKVVKNVAKLVANGAKDFTMTQFVVIVHVLQKLKDGRKLFSEVPPELSAVLSTGVENLSAAAAAPESPKAAPPAKPTTPTKPAKSPKRKAADSDEEPEDEGSGDVDWSISDAMAKKLVEKFSSLSGGESEVPSIKAMKVMMKSGVKQHDIGAVVSMVCGGKPKTVNEAQFVVCMVILQNVRKGAAIPSELPEPCDEYLNGGKKGKKGGKPAPPAKPGKPGKPGKKPARDEDEDEDEGDEDEWDLDKATYSKLKKMFMSKTDGEEEMAPALAMKEFRRAGVEDEDLKSTMKLVLRGHKGPITLGQFVVLMFMLKKVKEGEEVPSSVPGSLRRFL